MGVSVLTHGLRGYASVFGVRDDKGTIVDRGAFLRSIGSRVPKFGCSHSLIKNQAGTSLPIGVITILREDARGLYYEARLHDTPAARDVLECVAGGSMTGASFAFDFTTADGSPDRSGTFHLTHLDLFELGPVPFPSNPQATCEVFELPKDPSAADINVRSAEIESAEIQEATQLASLLEWAAMEIKR